jgi:hypothetical protein
MVGRCSNRYVYERVFVHRNERVGRCHFPQLLQFLSLKGEEADRDRRKEWVMIVGSEAEHAIRVS